MTTKSRRRIKTTGQGDQVESVDIDIVEIYMPARLEYLSGLYGWLNKQLTYSRNRAVLRGFSIYEVNGAFRGQRKVYEERTLVVRLIFDVAVTSREMKSREDKIGEIGRAVIQITRNKEEVIWITRTPSFKYAIAPGEH